MRPAAHVGERGRQFPVIECVKWLQAALEQSIDQTVIEVERLRVGRTAPFGHDPRPAC